MSPTTWALLLGACVAAQAFFSGSEIALLAADRLLLRAQANDGNAAAARALALLERPTRLVTTCLAGVCTAAVAGATVVTNLLAQLTQSPGLWVAVLWPPVTMLFAEMLPKSVFHQRATSLAPVVAQVISALSTVLSPALWVIERVTGGLLLILGVKDARGQSLQREDIQLLVDQSPSADIHADERRLIQRVFQFSETKVQDAMRPLIDVVAVSENATVDEAVALAVEHGFSRLPVFRRRVDRIVGVVLHSDLMFAASGSQPVGTVMHSIVYVPETKPVDELFLELRRKRQRLAVAVDEYGGGVGLISIEDILEEIVGEIEDEFDRRRPPVKKTGEREWVASARAEAEQLKHVAGFDLPDGDYETVAGFVLSLLGHVPAAGETVSSEGWTITVTKANERAILEVQLRGPAPPLGKR